jgi:hypothetical protein
MKAGLVRLSMRPLFRKVADQLIVALPENGIERSALPRPLEQLGFEDGHAYRQMRDQLELHPAGVNRRFSLLVAGYFMAAARGMV